MNANVLWFLLLGFVSLSACREADPFGAEPKGVSPNCGPEHRYKYDVAIRSLDDFIAFVKQHQTQFVDQHGNLWVWLDNFRNTTPEMRGAQLADAPVNWDKVRKSVVVEQLNGRTLYHLSFEPRMCGVQRFILKMTHDGHVSLYGCCGK